MLALHYISLYHYDQPITFFIFKQFNVFLYFHHCFVKLLLLFTSFLTLFLLEPKVSIFSGDVQISGGDFSIQTRQLSLLKKQQILLLVINKCHVITLPCRRKMPNLRTRSKIKKSLALTIWFLVKRVILYCKLRECKLKRLAILPSRLYHTQYSSFLIDLGV